MIITSGSVYFVYASNLDELVVENMTVEEVTVKFTLLNQEGTTATFSERYAIVDNKLKIYDVRDMLDSFFEFDNDGRLSQIEGSRGAKAYSQYVKLTLIIDDGTSESMVKTTVLWAGYANVKMTDQEIPYRMFLSRNPYSVELPQEGLGSVNFYKYGLKLKRDIVYIKDSVTTHITSTDEEAGSITMQLCNYSFLWSDILALVQETDSNAALSDLRYVQFSLINGDEEITDQMTFYREKTSRSLVKKLVFIGALGEIEVIHLLGQRKRSADFEGNFLTVDENYKKVSTDLAIDYEGKTGPMHEYERDLAYDLAESRWVYMFEDGELKPVTITEVNFDEDEPHNSPICMSVKYRLMNKKEQRRFNRSSQTGNDRVFTTDYTKEFS